MKFHLVESLVEFESLAPAWDGLAGVATSPLLCHDWFSAAARTLHTSQKLQVATLWDGGKLVAAAPLVATGRGLAERLEFIGMSPLYEPCHILFQDKHALNCLVRELAGLRRPLLLSRVPLGSPLSGFLSGCGSGRLVHVAGAQSNRVDVNGSWQDYLAQRSAQCRAGFPEKRRRLAAGRTVTFEAIFPEPHEVGTCLAEFARVEAASWKFAAGGALETRPSLRAFFHELLQRFAARRQVRLHRLRTGEQVVAAVILLDYGGRHWELKTAYDARWRNASPGRLLLWESLREAFARGVHSYEFLGVGDPQQSDWATSALRLQTVVWYPYSARGVVALTMDVGRSLMRRGREMVRRPPRGRDTRPATIAS